MENKGTKKIMLDDEELEQVSGGFVGIGGGEPRVGDTVKAVYNAELKDGPSEASNTIRFLTKGQCMHIDEILGDWYKVQLKCEDRITAFIHKSQTEPVIDFRVRTMIG